MSINGIKHIQDTLDTVSTACIEIENDLAKHFNATTNSQYKMDIENDMVTLRNLKHIIIAVKEDIDIEKIGASTELILRIAANDFKNKLAQIPEKKTLKNEIIKSLKEVHHDIFQIKMRDSDASAVC